MQLPQLQRPKQEAISLIGEQIKRGRQIDFLHLDHEDAGRQYRQWDRETKRVIRQLFDTDRYAKEFAVMANAIVIDSNKYSPYWRSQYFQRMEAKVGLLKEFQRRIEKHLTIPSDLPDLWSLIHPEIVKVSKSRFDSRHYADAAEAALKYINRYLKEIVQKATGNEYDGADLMRRAFSVNNPIIVIEDISTENGRSVQQGYMEIFAGAMMGVRNPKAHDVIEISRERGIHFLFWRAYLWTQLTLPTASIDMRFEPLKSIEKLLRLP